MEFAIETNGLTKRFGDVLRERPSPSGVRSKTIDKDSKSMFAKIKLFLILIDLLIYLVACQPVSTRPDGTSEAINPPQATIFVPDIKTPEHYSALASVTSTPIQTRIALLPIILHEGSFTFHPKYNPNDLSKVMFEFDERYINPNVYNGNDIRVDLTGNTDTFIVAMPMNGASGMYLKTVKLGANFDLNLYYEDCLQNVNGFLTGGKPFVYQGDLFCWLTNEGHLADFVIERLYGSTINWTVEIKYIVWDKDRK
jgi:hypothetical protein